MMRRRWVVWLPVLAFLLAGCSDWAVPYQTTTEAGQAVALAAGHPVGQTFVATHAGLDGVEIFLSPAQPGTGQLRLHLRADAQASEDVATVAPLPLAQITRPAFYRFSFPPLADSESHYYYVFVDLDGSGAVAVGAASGAAYLNGALYLDQQPLDAQMAFQLTYSPQSVLLELVETAGQWAWILVLAVLAYVVPGRALLAWLWPRSDLAWAETLGISIGVSLALYPVFFLWTDLFNLHVGPLYAWLPVAAGLMVLLWQARHWRPATLMAASRGWWHSARRWPDLTLAGLMVLVVIVRFWGVRTLEAPMWGDSYQHTVMTQLLVDHGGLFSSWQPYVDLQTFTYHFGFHADAAVFHWLTGMETPQAVSWTGQILNVLAVLALYPLAARVEGNRWAGVGAVLAAGLLSPMPMLYVNWGRYTQLAGQAILPGAMCLMWSLFEARRRDWRLAGLAAVVLGGLALTHYRVIIFAVIFAGVVVLVELAWGRGRPALARLAALGAGAGLIFLPWFVQVFGGQILKTFASQVTTLPSQLSEFTVSYNAAGDLAAYLPPWLWVALAAAIGWGLWRRNLAAMQVAGWGGLVLLAANPQWVGLPGAGVLSSFAVLIAVYIPAGALLGGAVGWLAADWQAAGRRLAKSWVALLGPAALCLAMVGVGLWGARQRSGEWRVAESALVTRPDVRAAAWIMKNTSPQARFLVNSFFAYGNNMIVGADGGWWLPLLAGRQTTVPPLTYASEKGPYPDYRLWINQLAQTIQDRGAGSAEALAQLRERGVTYVYLGQRQGRVNWSGPVLEPSVLLAAPGIHLVYHQDRVWIFALSQ